MIIRGNNQGYTMIELLIAMTVFSFMLMIVASAFLGIVRLQQAGIASRAAQQNNRVVIDAVSADLRSSNSYIIPVGGHSRICLIGPTTTMVEYIDEPVGSVGGNIMRFTGPIDALCPDALGASPVMINDNTTVVTSFKLVPSPALNGSLGSVGITSTVASIGSIGNLVAPAYTQCTSGSGSQFCAVDTAVASVLLRAGDTP